VKRKKATESRKGEKERKEKALLEEIREGGGSPDLTGNRFFLLCFTKRRGTNQNPSEGRNGAREKEDGDRYENVSYGGSESESNKTSCGGNSYER